MIAKHPYIRSLLETIIKEISDEEFQKRVWIKGEGPEVSSCGELFCKFFDDVCIEEIIKNYKGYNINIEQMELIESLKELMENYSDELPATPNDQLVINDPRWIKIREFAKKVYGELSV